MGPGHRRLAEALEHQPGVDEAGQEAGEGHMPGTYAPPDAGTEARRVERLGWHPMVAPLPDMTAPESLPCSG